MQELVPVTDERLKALFTAFEHDPLRCFQVKLRRVRAGQIRRLLANPAAVTLDLFNKEVWDFESRTILNGIGIKGMIFGKGLTPEKLAELDGALESGQLELHGNYVWGSATHIYGPMLQVDEQTKTGHIRRALQVLNSSALPPLEKAAQIEKDTPGFGPNITTGLVMLYHPEAFAISNTPSRKSLLQLGYDVGSETNFAQFERAAQLLREKLGAADYLQLDYFLYLISSGEINPSPRIVKIAPGEEGRLWGECLAGGYICISWDEVGDLRSYSSKAAFQERFFQVHASDHSQRGLSNLKAGELWTLMELLPGDLVVANRGTSEILGIGQVVSPGYTWRPERAEYNHTVSVRWDTAMAKRIPPQPSWAFHTVATVAPELYQLIIAPSSSPLPPSPPPPPPPPPPDGRGYVAPSFDDIEAAIARTGMRLSDRTLRRYHLSLKTRGFVILSGVSGTGKTWLAEAYAVAVSARHLIMPVAPNWTTNEDLLGYYNPIDHVYHDTPFSRFLREASQDYRAAHAAGRLATPYHLVLDELNLAHVEYYFARFLSAMETRMRNGTATIELGPGEEVLLTPNLVFVGTVNVDETTHGFADKVYDRAQLIELEVAREDLVALLGNVPYRDPLMRVWDALHPVAPFAFRVIDEIAAYVRQAAVLEVSWREALDDQLLQKVLPKCKGADLRIDGALQDFIAVALDEQLMLSHAKADQMRKGFQQHGFASYF
jgi:hypothetical protein